MRETDLKKTEKNCCLQVSKLVEVQKKYLNFSEALFLMFKNSLFSKKRTV